MAPLGGDLGARRSAHARTGLGGLTANLLGDGRGIDVHAHGLVIHDSVCGPIALPYGSIDAIYLDFESPFRRLPRVTLVTFEGSSLVLPRVEEMEHVLTAVDRAVTIPITEAATTAVRAGQRLEFGPLALTLDGIEFGGPDRSYPWSDVARAHTGRAELVLYGHEPRGRLGWVRLREIPHPKALFAALRLRTKMVPGGTWASLGLLG